MPDLLQPNDEQYGIHDLREATITGHRVEIGAGRVADELLGVRFTDCEIRIKSSGHATGVILSQCTFEDCTIWPSKIQKIANLSADFDRCTFKGAYDVGFTGVVSGCSFTAAKLNHASFYNSTDLKTDDIPGWPHVMIENLDQHRQALMGSIPKMCLLWIMARKGPHTIVVNLDKCSKEPSVLWGSIKDKPYVSFNQDAPN